MLLRPRHLIALVLTDALALTGVLWFFVFGYRHAVANLDISTYLKLWPLVPIFIFYEAHFGLYRGTWPRTRRALDSVQALKGQTSAITMTFLTLAVALVFTRNFYRYSRAVLTLSWLFLIPLLPALRQAVGKLVGIPYTPIDTSLPTTLNLEEVPDGLLLPVPRLVKACVGKLVALVAIIILFPLLVALAILVKCTSPGPVFYAARRKGLGDRDFNLYKFRTMRADADEVLEQVLSEHPDRAAEWQSHFKLQDDPRITRVGRFLRKTSLDELPQLVNILKGDMALVGPRPIVAEEVVKYGEYYKILVSVKPGLTGLWQVSGRSDVSYPKRVELDVYYITHWSLWLDAYILLKTPREILLGRGR